ncbi:MAG: cistern family PEP-CTERM protein [Candidatus Nitrosoglobus sp.]|jgi:hypothetical protein
MSKLKAMVIGTAFSFSLIAAPAQALLITNTGSTAGSPAQDLYTVQISPSDVGSSFDVDWLLTGSTPYPLTASSTWTVDSFNQTDLVLSIAITNNTIIDSKFNVASLLSFGFGVTPDVTAAFATSGQGTVFDDIGPGKGKPQNFPGGFKGIDVCIYAANGCAGGAQFNGLLGHLASDPANSDSIKIDLKGNFGSSVTLATLSDFPLKFQTTNGSFELAGTPSVPSVPSVPEPSILFLFGTSLLSLGFIGHRRRKP